MKHGSKFAPLKVNIHHANRKGPLKEPQRVLEGTFINKSRGKDFWAKRAKEQGVKLRWS